MTSKKYHSFIIFEYVFPTILAAMGYSQSHFGVHGRSVSKSHTHYFINIISAILIFWQNNIFITLFITLHAFCSFNQFTHILHISWQSCRIAWHFTRYSLKPLQNLVQNLVQVMLLTNLENCAALVL